MRVGVLLPTFETSVDRAWRVAAQAADQGIDGVFAYDHLWPMGSPTRPALAPLPVLSAIAARSPDLRVGPLVARVGLGSVDHVVTGLATLARVAPGRVIAALGTGDRLSAAENEAYGLAFEDADHRRAELGRIATSLVGTAEVWIGAGGPATNEIAASLDATLNVWDAPIDRVAELARDGRVSWAGPTPESMESHLDALRDAGATWAVVGPGADLGRLGGWRRANGVQ